jgi:hypothetical protein
LQRQLPLIGAELQRKAGIASRKKNLGIRNFIGIEEIKVRLN